MRAERTNAAAPVPRGIFCPTFDRISGDLHTLHAAVAGTRTPAETKRWYLDEARIQASVDECARSGLLLLDVLVDHDGSLLLSSAEEALERDRFEDPVYAADVTMRELVGAGLVIPYVNGANERLYKMCREVFQIVAPRVHGVSLPDPRRSRQT
ncbi:MAG: hypothetical protein R3B99_08195 [Polyangiales bacterium]